MSAIDEDRLWQALRAESVPSKILRELMNREMLTVDGLVVTCMGSDQSSVAVALEASMDQLDAFPHKVKSALAQLGAGLTAEQTRALDAAAMRWSNNQQYQAKALQAPAPPLPFPPQAPATNPAYLSQQPEFSFMPRRDDAPRAFSSAASAVRYGPDGFTPFSHLFECLTALSPTHNLTLRLGIGIPPRHADGR